MVAKPHRQNSDFQLRYFMANGCHTADGAWSLMYGQKEDMEQKIQSAEVLLLRQKAKKLRLISIVENENATEIEKLEAHASLLEMDIQKNLWEKNYEAAKMELATIVEIMNELEPQRKYKHLPDHEAHEAIQREEWMYELMNRVENFIVSQGTIPHDHLEAMRNHPDFSTQILPHIVNTYAKIEGSTSDKERFLALSPSIETSKIGKNHDNIRQIKR